MNINMTIIGQMLTFIVFILFTMYVVWPVLNDSLEKRRKSIEDGLRAAEDGKRALEESSFLCNEKIEITKKKCDELLENAKNEASNIISSAIESASAERDLILQAGNQKLEKEIILAKNELQKNVSSLILLCTEKLLQRCVTEEDQIFLLNICKTTDIDKFKIS